MLKLNVVMLLLIEAETVSVKVAATALLGVNISPSLSHVRFMAGLAWGGDQSVVAKPSSMFVLPTFLM